MISKIGYGAEGTKYWRQVNASAYKLRITGEPDTVDGRFNYAFKWCG